MPACKLLQVVMVISNYTPSLVYLNEITNLSVMATHITTSVGGVVIVDDFIVPQLCQSRVVYTTGSSNSQVFANIVKGRCQNTPIWIMPKDTAFGIVLGNSC